MKAIWLFLKTTDSEIYDGSNGHGDARYKASIVNCAAPLTKSPVSHAGAHVVLRAL